jgi:hypothetical protein
MQKQTCLNKKIQHNLKWKQNYDHPTFKEYKKTLINLFPLYCMKKIHERKEKNWKHWVLLGAGPNADGSCLRQDPHWWVLLAIRAKANGSNPGGPNAISSPSGQDPTRMGRAGQTQLNIFSLGGAAQPDQGTLGSDTGPKRIESWRRTY